MKTFISRFSAGVALASFHSLPLAAQTAEPVNLLPPDTPIVEQPVEVEADVTPSRALPAEATETVQPINPVLQPWTPGQANELLGLVEEVAGEGLDPADYDPAGLRLAIASGVGDRLNRVASQTFAWLIEDMRDGRTPMDARKQWFVVDPDADRYRTGDVMAAALASGDFAAALASVAPVHPDYAKLKEQLAATPVSDGGTRKLIRANMDRWRWLARDLGNQYLITNVPEYQLRLKVGDKIVRTYRTIVGKPGRTATPQLAETVEGVIFNPTWTVPQSIVKGEGLGARVLNNPGWARRAGYKATRGANGWVSVVQQPGPANALGRMKLDMPNRHAIFLHDTPSRGLFKNANRALSHGCIRTERASELAITLAILQAGLTADESVDTLKSGKYTKVGFTKTMPVYITYFTMGTDIDGNMRTFRDIYGRDAPVLASLDKPRVNNRSRAIDDEVIEIVNDPRVGA